MLHGYVTTPVVKPEFQPVALFDGSGPPHDPAFLFCNTVPPGEHGTGAPPDESRPQPGKEEPVTLKPARDSPFEPVSKIGQCRLPFIQPPEKPLGAEPVPETADLIPCPRYPAEQGGLHPVPQFLQPEREHVPVRDYEFGRS